MQWFGVVCNGFGWDQVEEFLQHIPGVSGGLCKAGKGQDENLPADLGVRVPAIPLLFSQVKPLKYIEIMKQ